MAKTPQYTVTIQDTGQCFVCGHNEFLLAAMLHAHSGPITHGCCGGGCGVCKVRIVSGSFETVKRMSRAHISKEEEQNGIVLLCCIQPRTDICISTI